MGEDFRGWKGGRDSFGRWIGGRFALFRRPGTIVEAGAGRTIGCGI